MERAGWIHTYTPSSKSQKSAAGEGAGRPSGGGGWTELGVASRGFRSVRLSCSRPAGAVPAHPPQGYGLPAQFFSLRSCSLVSTADTANAAPLSKPKPVVDILRGVGSSKQTSCCWSTGTLKGIWLLQSHYHSGIIKYLFGGVNTEWALIQCFFFLLSHDASLQDKNPTHIFVIQSLIHQALIAYKFAKSIPMMHHYTSRPQRCQSNTLSTSLRLWYITSHTLAQVLSNMSPLTRICLEKKTPKKTKHWDTVSLFKYFFDMKNNPLNVKS